MKKIKLTIAILFAVLSSSLSAQNKKATTLDDLKQMDSSTLPKEVDHLLKSKEEKDYSLVVDYYIYAKNKAKVDEVVAAAIKKFPKGDFALRKGIKAIVEEKDGNLKTAMLKKLEKEFPKGNFNICYFEFVSLYLREANMKSALEYVEKISKSDVLRYMAVDAVVKNEKSDSNLNKVKFLINEKNNAETNIVVNTAAFARKDQVISRLKEDLVEAYQSEGNMKEALAITEELYNSATVKSEYVKMVYGTRLAKSGSYEKAFPFLSMAVSNGIATDDTKNQLKKAYEVLGKKDYNSYLDGLNVKFSDSIAKHLAKTIIKEPAPKFILKDVDGKEVTNDDLKGKILIIDFWATWCGPCKKSFPAMQKAANKYKADKNVKFLFVHTFEKEKDPLTLAKAYLNENHYDFDLFMDYRNNETRVNQAANAFNVQGIPTKVIIDAQGNVRFKVVGFSGVDDAMVTELSTMIELSRS